MRDGAWPSLELQRLEKGLDDLVALVSRREPELGDETNAALARFLVVRICGYIEQVSEECCRAYLTSKSHPRVASFGQSWFGRGRNPTPDSLVQLVNRFDGEWAESLQNLLDKDDELYKRELAFLVDRRNRIAHGLSEGVGTRKALDLVEVGKEIGQWFITTFDPKGQ